MVSEPHAGRFRFILGVHDLSDPPDARGAELRSWMPFAQVRPLLDRLRDETARSGAALHVTCDDAFRSDYALLLPWLLDRGVGASCFVPTRFVGLPGRLSAAQIREMAALGLRIGAHGAGQVDWTSVPRAAFLADLREGRDRLEQILGLAVDTVALPFGSYDGAVLAALLREGFGEIHTTRAGYAPRGEPLVPRNMLRQDRVEAVLALAARPPHLGDALLCRLRRARAGLRAMAGAA